MQNIAYKENKENIFYFVQMQLTELNCNIYLILRLFQTKENSKPNFVFL